MTFSSVCPSHLTRLALGLCCLAAFSTASAQEAGSPTSINPRVERITHEDAGSRVDELRVGGVTRQIEVQTKSGLPGYQIQPATPDRGAAAPAGERTGAQGSGGRASWRLLNF